MAMYLAPEFKTPVMDRNLKINNHRLATHFDLHAMLYQIANGKLKPSANKYGLSLLDEIPTNRTCQSANIPVEYCTCTERVKLEESIARNFEQVARKVITAVINQELYIVRNVCEAVQLLRVGQVFQHQVNMKLYSRVNSNIQFYVTDFNLTVTRGSTLAKFGGIYSVIFVTSPGNEVETQS